jgi:biotin carboxyl carrier protein
VHTAEVLDERRRLRHKAAGQGGAQGRQVVRAPMPGRVVRVLVEEGQAVEARQGLVVVEAMKMENELRATHAGTVASVKVAPGAAVEAGAELVVVE